MGFLDCPWSASAGETKLSDRATGKDAAAPTSPSSTREAGTFKRIQRESGCAPQGPFACLAHGRAAAPASACRTEQRLCCASCASLCNVPRAGGGRTLVPMTSRAGHRRFLCSRRTLSVLPLMCGVPRAEGGTDVPACAGCPGIVDCARRFYPLNPGTGCGVGRLGAEISWETACKQPWSKPGGKSAGTPVSDAGGEGFGDVGGAGHDGEQSLKGIFFFLLTSLGCTLSLPISPTPWSSCTWCWSSVCSAHSHRLPPSDLKSNSLKALGVSLRGRKKFYFREDN